MAVTEEMIKEEEEKLKRKYKLELTYIEMLNLKGVLEGILEYGRDIGRDGRVLICYEPVLYKEILKKLEEISSSQKIN